MFIIMLDAALREKISAVPIMAMLIGFMTVTMLGFSPTVYASGYRVDFIFEMMCILSAVYMIGARQRVSQKSNALELAQA